MLITLARSRSISQKRPLPPIDQFTRKYLFTLNRAKRPTCGTAVSGATDAARGAAALVLTAPGLSVINNAIDEARRILGRIRVHSAEYVPNDPVLAGGIEGLQHNEKRLAAVRVKQILQLV